MWGDGVPDRCPDPILSRTEEAYEDGWLAGRDEAREEIADDVDELVLLLREVADLFTLAKRTLGRAHEHELARELGHDIDQAKGLVARIQKTIGG